MNCDNQSEDNNINNSLTRNQTKLATLNIDLLHHYHS